MSKELNGQQNASVGMTVGMIEVRFLKYFVDNSKPRKPRRKTSQ